MSNEKTNVMRKIYYSPEGYWKGYSAVSKLASAANVVEKEARDWLERQALWQIYLPPHSLQVYFTLLCEQICDPSHSLQYFLNLP